MKIIKIGTFDNTGMPTGWHFDLNDRKGTEYCLGLDLIFSGSVDINGIEMCELGQARQDPIGRR